ncbi:MAG: reprolysin-like metallopeptidase [Bacteroidia bacterium]
MELCARCVWQWLLRIALGLGLSILPILLLAQGQINFSEKEIAESVLSVLRSGQDEVILPLPDGSHAAFKLRPQAILADELAQKFPEIKAWYGVAPNGWEVYLDHDANRLHALLRKDGKNWFLDPEEGQYILSRNNRKTPEEALCLSDEKNMALPAFPTAAAGTADKTGLARHHVFRCAIAATGEYTAYHGGTTALAMAEIVSVLNRVNAVFSRDVAISFQLVAGNDQLIFSQPNTDPFTNGDLNTIIQENQNLIDAVIGDANYDVGIVFGRSGLGGGAIAYYNSVCQSGYKAQAAIVLNNPIGDGFAIDFVAHEFGHFFGAHHTHNNPCYRFAPTAYEPRSGSTIMAYAGVCSPSFQQNSDAYFHASSIDEIRQSLSSGYVCGQVNSVSNQAPIVIVNQPTDFLPVGTPFSLDGFAIDAEGDSLSYCWEQWDLGSPGSTHANTVFGPIIRSREPVAYPHRLIPQLSDILSGQSSGEEILPMVSRNLRFRLTVRDHHPQVTQVGQGYLNLKLTQQAGPFVVNEPIAYQDWTVGSMQWIKWEVANTDKAPVNCDKVDIWLSADGGHTFNTLLASNISNNGAAAIMVPDLPTQSARIRISATNNIFFAISEGDFTISNAAQADYYLFNANSIPEACQGDLINFRLWLGSLGGYQGLVNFSLLEETIQAQWQSNNPLAVENFLDFSITPSANLSGWQNITLLGVEQNGDSSLFNYSYYIIPEAPAAISTLYPADGVIQSNALSRLKWECQAGVEAYYWELASHPSFGSSLIANGWSEDSLSANMPPLDGGTVYYWRVKGGNACGEGAFSRVTSFMIPGQACQTFWSTDVPKTIPINSVPAIVISDLQIDDDYTITDINVLGLTGTHSWINDLKIKLKKQGVSARLFEQICGPNVADFDLAFDDEAPRGLIPCPPTSGLRYQALDSLGRFRGLSSQGLWRLEIKDVVDLDGGELTNWGLEICFQTDESLPPNLLANEGLSLNQWQNESIGPDLLDSEANCGPDDIVYTLIEKPQYGELQLAGNTLTIGDTFLQSAIDSMNLSYQHQGQAINSDGFSFTVRSHDGGWLATPYFPITINFTTPLEEDLALAQIKLYPNPAQDFAYIEFSAPTKEHGQLELIDLQGRSLRKEAFPAGAQKIKLSRQGLSSGLYFVRVSHGGQTQVLRCLFE